MIFVPKEEGKLKSKFGAELKRQAPGFLVLQYSTNGAPDREIIGHGVTTRWEAKHATPDFRSPGDQELMCARLAAAAHCRYIVWFEDTKDNSQYTLIVHPSEVLGRRGDGRAVSHRAEAQCFGFDMKWLVRYVLKEHGA